MGTETVRKAVKSLKANHFTKADIEVLHQALAEGIIKISWCQDLGEGGSTVVHTLTFSEDQSVIILSREALDRLLETPYQPPELPSQPGIQEIGGLPPGSRLPLPMLPSFVGREDDLQTLADALLFHANENLEDDIQGVVVTGAEAIGKTRLAVEFCYRYGRFFKGVHWIQASYDVCAEVAACGLKMGLSPWPKKIPEQVQLTLTEWAENQPQLLVLDSAKDFEAIKDCLLRLKGVRLLITSPEENWPEDLGLRVHKLGALKQEEGVELLRKLAPRLHDVPDSELEMLADHMGNVPMGLDLAGRLLQEQEVLSIEAYIEQLKQVGGAVVNQIQQSFPGDALAAAFHLNWATLEGNAPDDLMARKQFCLCGFCAENVSIPISILTACANDEKNLETGIALQRLGNLGLLLLGDGDVAMHPLINEFARKIDRACKEGALLTIAGVLAKICSFSLEKNRPTCFAILRAHVRAVAEAAEAAKLISSGKLWGHLAVYLKDSAEYLKARKCFERALAVDEHLLGPDHPDVAALANDLAFMLRDIGDLEGAEKAFNRVLAIDEAVFGPNYPEVATDVVNLGNILQAMGDLPGAKVAYQRALAIDEAAYGMEQPKVARDVNNLASVLWAMGDLKGAREAFEWALSIWENELGEDHPQVAIASNNLGNLLMSMGDLQAARKACERALSIWERSLGEEHQLIAAAANNLGSLRQSQGDLQGAKECFERARKIWTKLLGENHPLVGTAINNFGSALEDEGRFAEAKRCFEKTLAIDEAIYGPEHAEVATDLTNLGGALKKLEDFQTAKDVYERAPTVLEKIHGPEGVELLEVAADLGSVYWTLGDLLHARETYEKVLLIDEKVYGHDNPRLVADANNLGMILQDLNDHQAAAAVFYKALSVCETIYGKRDDRVAMMSVNLAGSLSQIGQQEQAKAAYERALSMFKKTFPEDHPYLVGIRAALDRVDKTNGGGEGS